MYDAYRDYWGYSEDWGPQGGFYDLYPESYRIINPHCEREADQLLSRFGPDYVPRRGELDAMVDRIYADVESDVFDVIGRRAGKTRTQQFIGFGGRRILRDFIAATLLASLLARGFFRRRFFRRPFFGFGGPFFGGF